MRIAQIDKFEVCNGNGCGVSLYVQGCHTHCAGCFNEETWDFNGGEEFTEEKKEEFLNICRDKKIKRVTILGGEPLADENVADVYRLICRIPTDKKIWLYTGFTAETKGYECFGAMPVYCLRATQKTSPVFDLYRSMVLADVDVVVDGQYVESLKDPSLKFKGSSNQRVIDVQKSLKAGEIILYD